MVLVKQNRDATNKMMHHNAVTEEGNKMAATAKAKANLYQVHKTIVSKKNAFIV